MHVLPFSEENLSLSLSNEYTSVSVISQKLHFRYFKDYFSADGLNAKTIVIEENYISKDFLHDYASYYAFCFERYPKFCKRVHFFQNSFSEDDLKKNIIHENEQSKEFWSHYLGFIVVKPIPVTVIGYSVLKTYPNSDTFNNRNFWGLRNYQIHVFGHELTLLSLAFQEQDSVLSACATTAIWSMLNKAAIDFHTILKSPNQITRDADNVSPDGSRLFPNKGLNVFQICQAIFNSGLVSEVKQPDSQLVDGTGKVTGTVISIEYLKKILNAYSPIGIPLILVVSVPNGENYGLHAITVSGFRQKAPTHIPPKPEISWMANNIDKFYAHDDQWGPFARVKFKGSNELETTWTLFDGQKRSSYVTNIVVPIYPKIRISYEDIEVIVLGLDTILTIFLDNKIISDLVWDIKIDFSENFKRQIVSSVIDDTEKLHLLEKSLPKYLWIVTCYIGENKILVLTFDATDVNNGMIAEDIISYLPADLAALLNKFLITNQAILQSLFKHRTGPGYYDFLIKKFS